jgi:hypothetical protein
MICIARCVYNGLRFALAGYLLAHPAVWLWRVSEKVVLFGKTLWYHQSSGFANYEHFVLFLICSLRFWLFLAGCFAVGFSLQVLLQVVRGSHA